MESRNEHNSIMMALGSLDTKVEGINKRLDTLNGSVAKHADKFNAQDLMNVQTTITQQQIVKDLNHLQGVNKEEDNTKKQWIERLFWSVVVPALSFLIILTLTKLGILNLQ